MEQARKRKRDRVRQKQAKPILKPTSILPELEKARVALQQKEYALKQIQAKQRKAAAEIKRKKLLGKAPLSKSDTEEGMVPSLIVFLCPG